MHMPAHTMGLCRDFTSLCANYMGSCTGDLSSWLFFWLLGLDVSGEGNGPGGCRGR